MASKAVAKVEEKMQGLIPLTEMPDYLSDTKQDSMGALDQDDFKIPRIKLLQPLNPEVQTFQGKAIPGEFWHTGANKSLGETFNMVVCAVNKRVILWAPRDGNTGGGMLALSRNGSKWDMGGNQAFSVKIKNVKAPVIWHTGKSVEASGLLEWGSFNPDDETSTPAAQLAYEYLVYLPKHPELSPVVLGLFRTAIPNAKQFNTSLMMLRKPIQAVLVRCFADIKGEGSDAWWIPQFETMGWNDKETFDICRDISEKNKEYDADYTDETAESQKGKEARVAEVKNF